MTEKYRYLVIGMIIGAALIMGADLMTTEKQVVIKEFGEKVPSFNNNIITGYKVPEKIEFAGEIVPMERPDVRERLEREILVNAFWHSNSVIIIKRANKWLPTIDSILLSNKVPSDFKYLCVAESGLDNVISPSNAVGFWQFLKGTARDFGLTVNNEIDQRYDPILSTVAATKYLKQAYKKFGNWTIVAASYNLGMNATDRILDKQRSDTYYDMLLSEEPNRYVFRILALKNLLENTKDFGFEIPNAELYQFTPTRTKSINKAIADLHLFAEEEGINYSALRKLNPWIRAYQLNPPEGRILYIKLPIK